MRLREVVQSSRRHRLSVKNKDKDSNQTNSLQPNPNHTMKRLLLTLCLTLLALTSLPAQSLTTQERDRAVKYLKQTQAEVLAATKGLSEAQWNFQPASNRWSVAEVTEHIAAAEDFLMDMVRNQVMKAPGRTNAEDLKALDELVLQKIPDRTVKAQAPEPLRPTNRYGSPKASLKHFKESRAKTIEFVKADQGLARSTRWTVRWASNWTHTSGYFSSRRTASGTPNRLKRSRPTRISPGNKAAIFVEGGSRAVRILRGL